MNALRLRIGIVGKGALGLGLQSLLSPFFEVQFSVDNAHLVFFCVKSYQLETAIKEHFPQISPGTPVISLSNGWIEPLLDDSFRLGVATIAFTKTSETSAVRKDKSGKVFWGALSPNAKPSRIERLVFEKLPLFAWTETPRELHRQKWLFNTSLNCSLVDLRLNKNGEMLTHLDHLRSFFEESFSLGELKWGAWPLPKETYWTELIKLIQDTAENQNSMTADIANGRKTEIEFLAGLALPYSGFPHLKTLLTRPS